MRRLLKNYLFIVLQCINLIFLICFLLAYNLLINNSNEIKFLSNILLFDFSNDVGLAFFLVYIVFPIISLILWILATIFNLKNKDSKIKRINFYVPFLINLGFINLYHICKFYQVMCINIFHIFLILTPLLSLILIVKLLKNKKNNLNSKINYIFKILVVLLIFVATDIWLGLFYLMVYYYSSLGV
ncbi:hypothetical protein KHQ81_00920 [Mycoplasmatota bacterium]|nr:hypothetical protein KHQ81_00920 [Mycoplasmatota bacterium]